MASCSPAASKAVSKARLLARHKYQQMRVIERESGEGVCVCVEMETKKGVREKDLLRVSARVEEQERCVGAILQ
jgi:hypothetical protein